MGIPSGRGDYAVEDFRDVWRVCSVTVVSAVWDPIDSPPLVRKLITCVVNYRGSNCGTVWVGLCLGRRRKQTAKPHHSVVRRTAIAQRSRYSLELLPVRILQCGPVCSLYTSVPSSCHQMEWGGGQFYVPLCLSYSMSEHTLAPVDVSSWYSAQWMAIIQRQF